MTRAEYDAKLIDCLAELLVAEYRRRDGARAGDVDDDDVGGGRGDAAAGADNTCCSDVSVDR